MTFRNLFILILAVITLSACTKDEPLKAPLKIPLRLELPDHFPTPPIPEDNPITQAKVDLGKALFFDPILSRDSTISCGSCHFPEKAFSDTTAFSQGVDGLMSTRNSPALINVIYGRSFFWDGANPSLETQILFPIEAENEMDNNVNVILERLKNHPYYPEMFLKAFGTEPDVTGLLFSIASYERMLISDDAPFDRWHNGDENAMSESAKRGMDIFFGENAECFHCHGSFNFTDGDFHNNGLYEEYEDPGRWGFTGDESDIGRFKTPTLRNIELTAPYMHDGSKKKNTSGK